MVSEKKPFENVDGRTTDGRQRATLFLKLRWAKSNTYKYDDWNDENYTTQNFIRAELLILFAGGPAYLIPNILW